MIGLENANADDIISYDSPVEYNKNGLSTQKNSMQNIITLVDLPSKEPRGGGDGVK